MYKAFPGAEKYFQNSVSLPIFYKMNEGQIKFVVNTLINFFKKNKNFKKKFV
jgi:dTDP-4-amino-4,6-dideoxygalactose transaminase